MEKEVQERFERIEKNLERNQSQLTELTTNVAVMQGALANLIDVLAKQHGNGRSGG